MFIEKTSSLCYVWTGLLRLPVKPLLERIILVTLVMEEKEEGSSPIEISESVFEHNSDCV